MAVKTGSAKGFVEAHCHLEEKATEAVLWIWELYLAWCAEGRQKPLSPDSFFKGLKDLGVQVSGGYAHGLRLNDQAKKKVMDWAYTPLPPAEPPREP